MPEPETPCRLCALREDEDLVLEALTEAHRSRAMDTRETRWGFEATTARRNALFAVCIAAGCEGATG